MASELERQARALREKSQHEEALQPVVAQLEAAFASLLENRESDAARLLLFICASLLDPKTARPAVATPGKGAPTQLQFKCANCGNVITITQ